ncbi:thermonuclease family protein [Lederbergia sp. NSJ-179]|uniref:thermonuclease family protein n=1 Tax=Lederbergia sp. NSJ-179 TaxID=2931402 RepID=UPI002456E5B5|nr:thermonuclease family protein [Lederbergia sp. NSJ-179]
MEKSGILSWIKTSGTTQRIPVEWVKVNDGDTIAVIYKGSRERVRFLLVDSPETSHPRLGEQPYGEEAKEFTRNLVENAQNLELEFDIGPNRDKYGRLLAYVYVDGKMIQEELLKKGLARVAYVYPPNTRYVDQFNAIQKEAQQKGAGIWEIENYAQEDGFHPELLNEKDSKDGNSDDCRIKGNIGSSEKIYHTPDSPWYRQTKPEVMFCTEEEAVKAGFRPPKQ